MKKSLQSRAKLVSAATAVVMSTASFSALAGSTAHADAPSGGVLGDVGQVKTFADKVLQAYGLFDQYVLGHEQPTQLQQIQAMIIQAQTQIISQMDALATANVNSEADTVVEQFENVDTMTPDQLASFVTTAVRTVTDIKSLLPTEQTKAAQDQLGFDLNIIGPIALFASAKAGQQTDILKTDLIQANQNVLTALAPACAPQWDVAGGGSDGDLITGHIYCRAYNATGSTSGVGGVGKSADFPVYGEYVDDYSGPFHTGYHYDWPNITNTNTSQGGDIAMAATSYPLAQAALNGLRPAVSAGPQIGSTLESGTDSVGAQVGVFQVTPATGAVHDGTLTTDTSGVFGSAEFSGWSQRDSDRFVSVAVGTTKEGRVHAFGIDRTGILYQRWELTPGNTTQWSHWARMSYGPYNSVAVARNGNGTLQVVATSPDGTVHATSQILNGDYDSAVTPNPSVSAVAAWSPWATVSGASLTGVALATDQYGVVHAIGVTTSGALVHATQSAANAATWTGWTAVPHTGALKGVTAAYDFDHQLHIFANDAANNVFQTVNLGSAWTQIPGTVHALSAVKEGGGSGGIELLGLDAQGNTVRNWGSTDGSGTSWKTWTPLDKEAYSDSANHLWAPDAAGFLHDYGAIVKPGTTPVSVKLQHYNNQYETAFVGTDNALWLIDPHGTPRHADGGLGVAPGTSPSIAAGTAGGYEVAFHAYGTDLLWAYKGSGVLDTADAGGAPVTGAQKVAANSSPSVTALTSGLYEIAYVGQDGALYEAGGAVTRRAGNGLGVAPGTSPSIAAGSGGGYQIAWNASSTNLLWTIDQNNVGTPDKNSLTLKPGTSPSEVWLAAGGYEVAFTYSDGLLWFAGAAGSFRAANGLGVAAGTSPSLVAGVKGQDFKVAFHASGSNHLWTVSTDNIGRDTQITLGANESPSLVK